MSGQAVLYGEACWSIATRTKELPIAGKVIILECGVEDRGNSGKWFRLARKSIEIVKRCLGMRTRGVAVAFFDKKTEPEPSGDPLEECQNVHRKAALDLMMYGIEPTEPCPICGEIPKFGNAAMSLNFYSDGPVKGVDGEEYTSCPACGDDALELQGNSFTEWGWKIVCLNCSWEKKQAESLDINQYCDLMKEVKSKVESINQLIEVTGLPIRTRVESICLQLRMLVELIVFSSLVSNKDVWQKSKKELQSSQDIGKKLRELKRLHPKFYPKPVDLRTSGSGKEPSDLTEGFLNEDKLIKVYGRLGNILHAENPLGKGTDYQFFIDAVPGWISEVKNLLDCHKVYLYHHPEEFYLIKIFGDVDGELLCIRYRTTAEGEAKCAWPDCVSSSARLYCEYLQCPWRECQLPEMEPAQTLGKREADKYDGADAGG